MGFFKIEFSSKAWLDSVGKLSFLFTSRANKHEDAAQMTEKLHLHKLVFRLYVKSGTKPKVTARLTLNI